MISTNNWIDIIENYLIVIFPNRLSMSLLNFSLFMSYATRKKDNKSVMILTYKRFISQKPVELLTYVH